MASEGRTAVSFPVLRLTQPIGDFYIGAMGSDDLISISHFDIRRMVEERQLDMFMGIQRDVDPKRLKEIQQYVSSVDATFPTGVVLAVDERCASIESVEVDGENVAAERFAMMRLSEYRDLEDEEENVPFSDIATVIDGQHRIAALEGYSGPTFEINVVVFIGIDVADQAGIFSTVNLAQTKVNRSLVYDLFSYSRVRSPQKTCHEIVVALDKSEKSPFYQRIKRLGVSTKGRFGETLSQATFVRMLLPYISSDSAKDLDLSKRGKKPQRADSHAAERLIFRNLFIDKKDTEIAEIIWNYFDAVKRQWPDAWASTGTGYVLARTNGFRGFMRFLRHAYRYYTTKDDIVSSEDFSKLFRKTTISDDSFTSENFKPGTSGETAIYRMLVEQVGVE